MSTTISLQQLTAWISGARDQVVAAEADLTALDRAIGDGDHGANMARGMKAAVEKLEQSPPATIADLGKNVGMALVSAVGGASGPLYGTFFLRLGTTAGPVTELDTAGLAAAFEAGYEGVVTRGKAERGEKTMLDALGPAVDALKGAGDDVSGALKDAAQAADAGREATIDMEAHKGRASYLGERSIGHMDPGAASSALFIGALVAAVTGPPDPIES